MLGITDRQKEVLDFIVGYTMTNMQFPTIRRICVFLGATGTNSAMSHINALRAKGFLGTRQGAASRKGFYLTDMTKEIYKVAVTFTTPVKIWSDAPAPAVNWTYKDDANAYRKRWNQSSPVRRVSDV